MFAANTPLRGIRSAPVLPVDHADEDQRRIERDRRERRRRHAEVVRLAPRRDHRDAGGEGAERGPELLGREAGHGGCLRVADRHSPPPKRDADDAVELGRAERLADDRGELVAIHREQRRVRLRLEAGGPLGLGEDRHLAEEVAGTERRRRCSDCPSLSRTTSTSPSTTITNLSAGPPWRAIVAPASTSRALELAR